MNWFRRGQSSDRAQQGSGTGAPGPTPSEPSAPTRFPSLPNADAPVSAPSPQPPQGSGGGWGSFLQQGWHNLQPSGMVDRYRQTRDVRRQLEEGTPASGIDIPADHHRLRNFADMREISRDHNGPERPAADSIGDANGMFYTFFGNNGGDFSGMDREELRRVGRQPVPQARQELPNLEAEAFRHSQDPRTQEFGRSLPPENRDQLFTGWAGVRSAFPPSFPSRPPGGSGGTQ